MNETLKALAKEAVELKKLEAQEFGEEVACAVVTFNLWLEHVRSFSR